jgi:hypothetical protein
MPPVVLDETDTFDISAAESAVAAASSGNGNAALKACLDQIRLSSEAVERSSVTYNVWQEWIQSNIDPSRQPY